MFKNKFFGFAILVSVLLTFIMVVMQIPSVKSELKDVPVAIVNEDNGNQGNKIVQNLTSSKNKTLDWHVVKSEKKLNKAMDKQHYYAAIVIPKDFSLAIGKLADPTSKKAASITVMTNEAKNATLSTTVGSTLSTIITKMGGGISAGILTNMVKNNSSVPAATALKLNHPITVKTIVRHSTSGLSAANSSFFQPIWIASMVISLLLFYAGDALEFKSMKHKFSYKSSFIISAITLAVLTGFATATYATWILGFNFTHFITIASFLSFTSFAFIMLFSGVLTWIGFPGVIVFVLLLFFSIPLLAMAQPLVPQFYQDWVLPWLPMRFLYDGARSILYYGASFWNSATVGLTYVLAIGSVLFFAEGVSSKHRKVEQKINENIKVIEAK
ncbi:YhgE/Pip domain-containing protein [Dellaglioa sp. L3N]